MNGQTRARPAAREAASRVVALGGRVPPMVQRTPRVAVDMALGPVRVVVAVARRRHRGRLEVRMPEGVDGGVGVVLPPAMQAEAEAVALAAVRADPEARAYLAAGSR